jgi:hypothetical protein
MNNIRHRATRTAAPKPSRTAAPSTAAGTDRDRGRRARGQTEDGGTDTEDGGADTEDGGADTEHGGTGDARDNLSKLKTTRS